MRAYFSLCARRMHRKSEGLSFSPIYGCKAQGEQMLFLFLQKNEEKQYIKNKKDKGENMALKKLKKTMQKLIKLIHIL